MDNQLPADLYIRPAENPGADRHPTISPGLAEQIAKLPGVAAVDRLRAYEITYDGLPLTLGAADLRVLQSYHSSAFFSGRTAAQVLADLNSNKNNNEDAVLVSEPFTYKHHVKTGDTVRLLSAYQAIFRVADIYYDYSSERGNILMTRNTFSALSSDPAPSNIAVTSRQMRAATPFEPKSNRLPPANA